MVIELRGVEFVNKGAELMLLALKDKIKNYYPDVILVMEKSSRAPRAKLMDQNIYTKLNYQRFKINWSKTGKLIPKNIRRANKFILENEIDFIIDASGFAYGDQWGTKIANNRLIKHFDKWNKMNIKVIMLPQAYGPFNESGMRVAMDKIIHNVELIFAREQKSYDYLRKISKSEKIRKAPDFTNLISGNLPMSFDSSKLQVAIIPNYKMIEHSKDGSEKLYYEYLVHNIEYLISKKLKPFFLIHEGRKDMAIAKDINQFLKNEIPIMDPQNALLIKGVIGKSLFVLSSRFHGVVSALSQGVPCIITSWSHKYKLLAEEYDFQEFLISDLKNITGSLNTIDNLLDPENRKFLSNQLLEKSNRFKLESEEMWKEVFMILDRKK